MNFLPIRKLLSGFFFLIALATVVGLPAAVAQEQPSASEEEVAKLNELLDQAKEKRIDAAVQENKTGTDPRDFSLKWMPFYRFQELENGLTQQDLTAFGTVPFSRRLGMFFEVPLAQYRDFSDIVGVPSGTDAIGIGDIDLKFLWNPESLGFNYGKDGKKSGAWLFGTDFVLPTATDDALAGDALLFAPIVGLVVDMPLHGFFAMLNLYFVDVYKKDAAPDTSRFVGRWFYMQPLTPPGKWWGGLYLMPEFQPIYDFETDDFSLCASWNTEVREKASKALCNRSARNTGVSRLSRPASADNPTPAVKAWMERPTKVA